ncbi:unnamed protein product [Meloidogyne enterolobii]|uniref:Uncharacterized protein n=1 Tax=Meloidogyne enterolobii TaxID=390850 RepID=A0ACB0YSE4_MELEN
MLKEDNYRSRKRIKQSRISNSVSGCLVIFFLTQIQPSSSTNRLFARSVPRGYQPPPTSPLVEDVPVMQYKQYKPPSRFSHPSSNNLPSFKHPSVAGEAKEPLMVNTLIQVFGPEKGDETETEKQRLSTFVGETSSEQNSPTPPTELLNGQKRVTLTRQLDTFGRTFVPANQTVSTANPKIAIVKAFAASNSSQISEAQLREELGKELEQSVSLILDELGRKDKTTKRPVTLTTQSVPAEELERLEGEENEATTSPKETENSVVSTREATSVQTASTTSVAPLVVFPKTSKEPIEVAPATNVATTTEASDKEKKDEATTVGIKEEHNQEENEITSTKETLTEENIEEIKSTTIAPAQIYKSAEKKSEAETNLPVTTTINIEESPTTPTIVKQEETKEETLEKPTYPTEEEKEGVTIEGSLIFDKKTTVPEEIAFNEDEASITETITEEKKTTVATTLESTTLQTTIQTTPETLLQTNSENVLSKEQQEVEEEEIKEQQKQTTLNVVGNREVPGPGWQRTDFEEGQLWVQCKPPSIRVKKYFNEMKIIFGGLKNF